MAQNAPTATQAQRRTALNESRHQDRRTRAGSSFGNTLRSGMLATATTLGIPQYPNQPMEADEMPMTDDPLTNADMDAGMVDYPSAVRTRSHSTVAQDLLAEETDDEAAFTETASGVGAQGNGPPQSFLQSFQKLSSIAQKTGTRIKKTEELDALSKERTAFQQNVSALEQNTNRLSLKWPKKTRESLLSEWTRTSSKTQQQLQKQFETKRKELEMIKDRNEKNDILDRILLPTPLAIPWFNWKLFYGQLLKKGKDERVAPPSWRFLGGSFLPDWTFSVAILSGDLLLIVAVLPILIVAGLMLYLIVWAASDPLAAIELSLSSLGELIRGFAGITL